MSNRDRHRLARNGAAVSLLEFLLWSHSALGRPAKA
jgi:hypothetical protein